MSSTEEKPRKRWTDQFEVRKVPADNRKGYKNRYVYIGGYASWTADAAVLRSAKLRVGLLTAGRAAIFLVCSCIACNVTRAHAVGLEMMLGLIPLVLETVGAIRFCLNRKPLQKESFTGIDRELRYTPWADMLIMAVLAVTGIITLFSTGIGAADLPVILGYILCGVCAFLMRKVYVAVPFREDIPGEPSARDN